MTMCKVLYPRDDRLYMSRKEEERGVASIDDCVDAPIQELKKYVKKGQKD